MEAAEKWNHRITEPAEGENDLVSVASGGISTTTDIGDFKLYLYKRYNNRAGCAFLKKI